MNPFDLTFRCFCRIAFDLAAVALFAGTMFLLLLAFGL